MAVLALPDRADGLQKPGYAPGQGPGKDGGQQQGHHSDDDGDGAQGLLDLLQKLPLAHVTLIQIDRSHGHAPVGHGDGGSAVEGAVYIVRTEKVLPPQGLDHLGDHGVAAQKSGAALAVIEDHPRRVGDQHPAEPGVAQDLHDPGHALLTEGTRSRQSRGHHQSLALEGGLLGLENHVLGGEGGIGIQKDQHGGDNDKIGGGVLDLKGPPEGHLFRLFGHGGHLFFLSFFAKN